MNVQTRPDIYSYIAAESADHSGSPHDDPNVGFRDPKSTPLHYRRYKPVYQRNYKKGISLQKNIRIRSLTWSRPELQQWGAGNVYHLVLCS